MMDVSRSYNRVHSWNQDVKRVGGDYTESCLLKMRHPPKAIAISNGTSSSEGTTSEYSLSSLPSHESGDGIYLVGLDRQISLMKRDSRFYLGLPNKEFRVINFISQHTVLTTRDILMTIKKIRLNDPNKRLADDFNLSVGHVSKIFARSVTILSVFFSKLVFWPKEITNKKLMPVPFRHRFMNVQSIVDCFEISIQKPQSPKYQALTWSEYKKCNTVKVLISANPCGFINFISKAYGGRISDRSIVKESGFLDVVPRGSSVLADRGFKQLEGFFLAKHVKLIRPASVSANIKPTKAEIRETKRIAATRIHIERVISRIREFRFLGPHARIHSNLVQLVDHCIVIAAGIVNLQEPIINMGDRQVRPSNRSMT
uniref:LL-diaminopimelate aminotransferase n=1 Tax=Lygus hesperus TaxID=30085 RepID=A0A0A9XL84_LYGHE